jgi:hypothetical protein
VHRKKRKYRKKSGAPIERTGTKTLAVDGLRLSIPRH